MLESLITGGWEWLIGLAGVIAGLFGYTLAGRRKAERDRERARAERAEADLSSHLETTRAQTVARQQGERERAKDLERAARGARDHFSSDRLHPDGDADD